MEELKHVAIIMDGNGRWAEKRKLSRSMGHREGSKTLEKLCLHIADTNIPYLSVFAFSTENFKRSDEEVNYLMNLFVEMFTKKCKEFNIKTDLFFTSCSISGINTLLSILFMQLENIFLVDCSSSIINPHILESLEKDFNVKVLR